MTHQKITFKVELNTDNLGDIPSNVINNVAEYIANAIQHQANEVGLLSEDFIDQDGDPAVSFDEIAVITEEGHREERFLF